MKVKVSPIEDSGVRMILSTYGVDDIRMDFDEGDIPFLISDLKKVIKTIKNISQKDVEKYKQLELFP